MPNIGRISTESKTVSGQIYNKVKYAFDEYPYLENTVLPYNQKQMGKESMGL